MKASKPNVSPAELQILSILWEKGPMTVRAVYNIIKTQKDVGYTTVLKQIQRMTDRGAVQRSKKKGIHTYKAKEKEDAIKKQYVNQLIGNAFGGSKIDMVLYALGSRKAAKRDFEGISAWLKEQKKYKR